MTGRTISNVRGKRDRAGRAGAVWSVAAILACGGVLQAASSAPAAMTATASYTNAAPLSEGNQVVARLETAAPTGTTFRLHGTVPVPPGTLMPEAPTTDLAIVDSDGQAVLTQIEIVSRYANENQGADVIEVIATVTRPSNASPGDRLRYDLCRLSTPVGQSPTPDADIDVLTSGETPLHPKVAALLANPYSMGFRSHDVFGNTYIHLPLEDRHTTKVLRHGPEVTQVRSHNVMWAANYSQGATGALPHLFGMHSYFTTMRDSPVVLFDLRIHNGFANTIENGPMDDVLNDVYFDGIDLGIPPGWSVVQAFSDPGFGAPHAESGYRVFPIVAGNEGGKLHVMKMGGQMVRRMALCPVGEEAEARRVLEQEGLAFALDGVDAETGTRHWSWSNPETARFLPQNMPLPSLQHVGLGYLRSVHSAELNTMVTEFAGGGVQQPFPLMAGKLGWAHPSGVSYGGATGGTEIHLFEGIDVVQSASLDGYRKLQLVHRAHTDRQPNVMYRRDGEHASLWDWYVEAGEDSFVPLTFYMKLINGNDPIGVFTPPKLHVDAVAELDMAADYTQELLGYQAHDLQHLIRYTRAPKALAWIGNDKLAIDDLFAQTELVRLSYHPFFSNPYGSMTVTGMRADITQSELNPGGAVDFGRGEGWATDTRSAAYALASDEWRERELPMLKDTVDMLARAQTCNGQIMGSYSSKIFDGNWRSAQAYETSIVDNAIRGLLETALRGKSAGYTALAEDVLEQHYYGFISPLAWSSTLNGPIEQYAVAPIQDDSTPFCTPEEQPEGGQYPGINGYQTLSTLGFAYDLTNDPIFLQRAEEMLDAPLFEKLNNDGVNNLANRAALISVVQSLNGVL